MSMMSIGVRAKTVENEMERKRKNLLLCIFLPFLYPCLGLISSPIYSTQHDPAAQKWKNEKSLKFCLSCHFGFVRIRTFFLCVRFALWSMFPSARLTLMNPSVDYQIRHSKLHSSAVSSYSDDWGKWRGRENVAIMEKKYSTREREKWWIDFLN